MNCWVRVWQARGRNAFTRAVLTGALIIPNNNANDTSNRINAASWGFEESVRVWRVSWNRMVQRYFWLTVEWKIESGKHHIWSQLHENIRPCEFVGRQTSGSYSRTLLWLVSWWWRWKPGVSCFLLRLTSVQYAFLFLITWLTQLKINPRHSQTIQLYANCCILFTLDPETLVLEYSRTPPMKPTYHPGPSLLRMPSDI